MSKAVLMSIRPEWCKKILSGEKIVEIRKSCPVHGTPFKVYIYCTRTASKEFILDDDTWDVSAKKHGGWPGKRGNVIGEFTCKKITGLTHVGETGSWESESLYVMAPRSYYKPADKLLEAACMTKAEAEKYLKGSDGYGWHISDLKIYNRPRGLDKFSRFGFWGMNGTKVCGNYGCKNYEPSDSYMIPPTCKINGCSVYRPPQSWCYVEDFCE